MSRIASPLMTIALVLLGAKVGDAATPLPDPSADAPETPKRRLFERFRTPRPSEPKAVEVPSQPPRPIRPTPTPRPVDARVVPDPAIRRSQAGPGDVTQPSLPEASMPIASIPTPAAGGQSLSLEAALYGALTSNPDLVALRQGNSAAASAEAVEVARQFPTTLNPTVWIDYRPITLIPSGTFGGGSPGGSGNGTGTASSAQSNNHGFYHNGLGFIYLSYRQPLELGHQTTHRYHIARAAYDQVKWTIVQAELTSLVQTYRFFQTAAYNREKTRVAQELADFSDRLFATLERRAGANQALPADVTLAKIESRATRQLVKAARQAYVTALTDLRNQIGIPATAGTVEPFGAFTLPSNIPPIDENAMIQTALLNRPDIHAARAVLAGAGATVRLAKANQLPNLITGPQYEMDEAGVQYIGFLLVAPLPLVNSGKSLVVQREAESRRAMVALEQAQKRAIAQVRAGVAKWNGARELLGESAGLIEELTKDVAVVEHLFEAGQVDLPKLMQARQRLIQLQNAQLDAVWQATQAQADLLLALGAPNLIASLHNREGENPSPVPTMPEPSSASPFQTAPESSTPAK